MKSYGFTLNLLDNASSGLRRVTALYDKLTNATKNLGAKISFNAPQVNAPMEALRSKIDNLTAKREVEVEFKNIAKFNQEIANTEAKLKRLETARPVTLKTMVQNQVQRNVESIQGGGLNTAMTVGAGASMYAYGSFVQEAIKRTAELSDKMASVQKVTGMTSGEALKLRNELSNLDTRTKIDDLLGISQVAGQMGIAKAQVKDFTKTVDMAAVAFKEDFATAQEAAEKLGKLGNIWNKAFPDTDISTKMNKIGSAMNELSTMGAKVGNMADFAARFAPSMSQLKPETILALGAGLEKMGTDSEIASSGLQTFFKSAYKESDTFAKVMGINKQQLYDMLNTDEGTKKFLGNFTKVFDGMDLSSKKILLSTLKVDDQQAQRAILGLMDLQGVAANDKRYANSLEELYAKAGNGLKEGTSLQNEFNLMNDTAAARIEKFWKKVDSVTIAYGDRFVGIFDKILSFVGGFNVDSVVNGMVAIGAGIGVATVAWLGFQAATLISTIATLGFAAAMQATGIPLIVIGIAALTAGIVYAYTEFESFRNVVNAVGDGFSWLWEKINNVYDGFAKLFEYIANGNFFSKIANGFKEIGKMFGFGGDEKTMNIEPKLMQNKSILEKPSIADNIANTALGGSKLFLPNGLTDKMPQPNKAVEKITEKTKSMSDVFDKKDKKDGGSVDKKGGQAVVGGGEKTTNFYINIQTLKSADQIVVKTITEASEVSGLTEESLLQVINGLQAKTTQ